MFDPFLKWNFWALIYRRYWFLDCAHVGPNPLIQQTFQPHLIRPIDMNMIVNTTGITALSRELVHSWTSLNLCTTLLIRF